MMQKKWVSGCSIGLVISGLALGLVGCHEHHPVKPKDNPLLTAKPEDAALFLYRARDYALKQTGINPNNAYITCMINPDKMDGFPKLQKKYEQNCHRLFQAMADYRHHSQVFHSVTYDDITSKAVLHKFIDALESPPDDEAGFKSELPRALHPEHYQGG